MNQPVDLINPEESERYLVSLLQPVTTRVLRDEALTAVDPESFASAAFAGLWEAARQVRDAEKPVNRRSILGQLAKTGSSPGALDVAGRILEHVAGVVPRADEFTFAVNEVNRCGQIRRLLEACDGIKQRAISAEDPSQALSMAYEMLSGLERNEDRGDVQHYAGLLEEFVKEQSSPDSSLVIPTPWLDVNEALNGGIRAGRMYVFGARPGDGKSIAAHQVAQRAAELGHASLVFSAEMGALEVTERMVTAGALVEKSDVDRRSLDDYSWKKVREYIERARAFPISIVDKSNLTIPYIKAVCRGEKRRNNTSLVVLDYLQLVGGDGRGHQREQEVAAISRSIKQLSRELDMAFVVAAQLNRENVRHNRRPVMADLRESGGIEADADVVILNSRPLIEEGERKGEPGWTLLMDIVKNRHGRLGPVELDWRANYATIGAAGQQDNVIPIRRQGA